MKDRPDGHGGAPAAAMDTRLPVAEPRAVRRLVRDLLRRDRAALAGTTGLFLLSQGIGTLGPAMLGAAVDAAVQSATRRLNWLVLTYLVVTIVGALLTFLARSSAARLGERVLADLRHRLVGRTLNLDLVRLESAGTGEFLSRVTSDVGQLAEAVRSALPQLVVTALTLGFTLGALIVLSPALALAAVIATPLVFLAGRWYARRSAAVYGQQRAANATLSRVLHEGFAGASTVRAYGAERRQVGAARRAVVTLFGWQMAGPKLRNVLRTAVTSAQYLGLAAVAVLGVVQVRSGAVSVGMVTAALLYILRVFGPISQLIEQLDALQAAYAGLARVAGVLELPEHRPAHVAGDTSPATAPAPGGTGVVMRGLRFAYRPGHEVLHGIDLTVAPGERLALVGPSGAGKSTIAKIIAGVHQPTAGVVNIGAGHRSGEAAERGTSEKANATMNPSQVVLVSQESHVFIGSVAENLRLAARTAPDARLRAALATVGVDWVDALPDGLHTKVGAGATRLTPAQAQQLALARLVLADPDVVVLDEATSTLDGGSAQAVGRALDAALAGRTVIVVAHRLDAVRFVDRIAVISDGRIAELGTHRDLLAAGGDYARLWAVSRIDRRGPG
jgi:ATP-binding cassette subfamily C protein